MYNKSYENTLYQLNKFKSGMKTLRRLTITPARTYPSRASWVVRDLNP